MKATQWRSAGMEKVMTGLYSKVEVGSVCFYMSLFVKGFVSLLRMNDSSW